MRKLRGVSPLVKILAKRRQPDIFIEWSLKIRRNGVELSSSSLEFWPEEASSGYKKQYSWKLKHTTHQLSVKVQKTTRKEKHSCIR